MVEYLVLCVASTVTSTYPILSLVNGATEYLDSGVTAARLFLGIKNLVPRGTIHLEPTSNNSLLRR